MVTPFNENEDIDFEAYRSNIEFYIKNGIHGLVTAGSTGEFASLSTEEHKQIIKTAVDQAKRRVPVLAGTGQCSTRQTIEMSKYAQDAGADGLLIIPPYYAKPSDEEIVRHYSAISDSVSIPIMLYNNPFTSKVDMKPEVIGQLADLQHVTHVKESSGDVTRIWKICNATRNKLVVFAGSDNIALESFLMGARGWVSITANVFPKECADLYDWAVVKKEIGGARELYSRLLPFCNLLEDTGMFAALSKAGLDLLGKKGGKPRGPSRSLMSGELEQVKSILRSFGKL
jgi:4-hydroxy-tetrahydrodipicolinate synthase